MELEYGGKILSDDLFERGGYRFGTSNPSENERQIRIMDYGEPVYPGDGTDLLTFTDREIKALLDGKVLDFSCGEYGILLRYKQS